MPLHLFIAPAAAGKTEHLLALLRQQAADLTSSPRLVVSTPLQRQAAQRRLAAMGGALGARILTMNSLGSNLLDAAGLALTRLADPVVVRFLRVALDRAELQYYAPLRTSPGLAQQLRRLFGELQKNNVTPLQFAQAVASEPPALQELAHIYQHYIALLRLHGASDGPGWVGRVTTLLAAHPQAIPSWHWLVFDGFDRFTRAEIALITLLSRHLRTLIITLPGADLSAQPSLVYLAAYETRKRLEAALGVEAEPLPSLPRRPRSSLHFLAQHLFQHQHSEKQSAPEIELIAAADMRQEVREALRWLKMRIVQDGLSPDEVALLARSLQPYRATIRQVAREMRLPLHIPAGLPLRENPVIAALLGLLSLPAPHPLHEKAFAFRPLINAWRSPYFDWQAYLPEEMKQPHPATLTADVLDRVGRWGRVLAGREQWEETLQLLMAVAEGSEENEEDEQRFAVSLPRGEAAAKLWQQFQAFVIAITPPSGLHPLATFVRWLEDLIGPDLDSSSPSKEDDVPSLQMLRRIREQDDIRLRERDLAALQALKDVLRGMVSAAQMIDMSPITYAEFLDDLQGAVEAALYDPAPEQSGAHILAADVVQAKGLSFAAVAVLGLAEGAFPATVHEDILLHDQERARLSAAGIPLELSLHSEEAAIFHQAITRPRQRLLLTRPRLAEGGAPWPESPYWQEVLRRVQVSIRYLTHNEVLQADEAASWPEVMQIYARNQDVAWASWLREEQSQRWQRLQHGVKVALQRRRREAAEHDGNLVAQQHQLRSWFGHRRVWSASQLETYQTCPYYWFSRYALHLEARAEPILGPDAAQLGNIYHELLKRVYAESNDPTDVEVLLAKLEQIAATELAQAPQKLGFRPSAWWHHTQAALLDTLQTSIRELVAQSEDWRPFAFEQTFGGGKYPPLAVEAQGETVLIRGKIDRVDVNGHNQARVIDYKSGAMAKFTRQKLASGELLQLPLYALAVEQSLQAGQVIDGFYWSVREAKASSLRLTAPAQNCDFDARGIACEYAVTAVTQIRRGAFAPRPPSDGCPPYCPAADFCWHYRPGWR